MAVNSNYKCNLCKDTQMIIKDKEKDVWGPCSCREIRNYETRLESSGIAVGIRRKRFDNFNIDKKDATVVNAFYTSKDYADKFNQYRNDSNHSLALLGQPGAGKTHLTIAIANQLMDQGIGVLYMPYTTAITELKQFNNSEYAQDYNKKLNMYKNATVLLIDDLFKDSQSQADMRIIFEIINVRYLNGTPVIISSEKTPQELVALNEAIGTRILEMCKGRVIVFVGKKLNHRIF